MGCNCSKNKQNDDQSRGSLEKEDLADVKALIEEEEGPGSTIKIEEEERKFRDSRKSLVWTNYP